MSFDIFEAARTPAAQEFERLDAHAADLAARVREIEQARDGAAREAARLSDELAGLERQRASGDDLTSATVAKAEKALTAARLEAGAPWPERIKGAQAAARAARSAAQTFAASNYHLLTDELREDAMAAKQRCDAVLEAVADAYAERARVSQRATALAALVGLREPMLVPESRLGRIVREAEAVMMSGGEVAPLPRREPIEEAA